MYTIILLELSLCKDIKELYYTFNYGDYHFLSINSYDMSKRDRICISFVPLNWGGSIREEQFEWIENDLKNTNSKMKFMFMHHNPLWEQLHIH